MKNINIREFCLRPASYLKELPIILTRYGKPVASIVSVDSFKISSHVLKEEELVVKPMTPTPPLEPVVTQFITQKQIKLCKHGFALGNCKFGCTKEAK
jgi:antitoxin (DNA-binding transcriptional repressor) of toxin-antitoxin stability system